jgi:hypothetical protein
MVLGDLVSLEGQEFFELLHIGDLFRHR